MELLELIKAIESGAVPAGLGFAIYYMNSMKSSIEKMSKSVQEMNLQLRETIANQTNDRAAIEKLDERVRHLEVNK